MSLELGFLPETLDSKSCTKSTYDCASRRPSTVHHFLEIFVLRPIIAAYTKFAKGTDRKLSCPSDYVYNLIKGLTE